jgi:hypothetical protein
MPDMGKLFQMRMDLAVVPGSQDRVLILAVDAVL